MSSAHDSHHTNGRSRKVPGVSTSTTLDGSVDYERTVRLLCAMAALDTIGKSGRIQDDADGLLDDLGIIDQDVELLVRHGLVRGSSGTADVDQSPLHVTGKGRKLLRECRHDLELLDSSLSGCDRNASEIEAPTWDRNKRVLSWGSLIIKSFRKTAPNQEVVLDSFEEDGWPRRIDDPIPPSSGIVPTVRLHDTIKRLNHGMAFHVIRFYGDGTGMGVEWRRLSANT